MPMEWIVLTATELAGKTMTIISRKEDKVLVNLLIKVKPEKINFSPGMVSLWDPKRKLFVKLGILLELMLNLIVNRQK